MPGTGDEIRAILYQRTADLAERLKQQQSREGVEQGTSQTPLAEDQWGGHEEVQSYLEMLQQDDDIEAYDIFDDFGEGND